MDHIYVLILPPFGGLDPTIPNAIQQMSPFPPNIHITLGRIVTQLVSLVAEITGSCVNRYTVARTIMVDNSIIESVDSIFWGSADMQSTKFQKKPVAKRISLDNNAPSIFKCFHDQQAY